MERVIVTLKNEPKASVEVLDEKVERSVPGALRLFPGVPKAISFAEYSYIQQSDPKLHSRLLKQPYVASKRVDRRDGYTEIEVEAMAKEHGLDHLPHAGKMKELRRRKLLKVKGEEAPKEAEAPKAAKAPKAKAEKAEGEK